MSAYCVLLPAIATGICWSYYPAMQFGIGRTAAAFEETNIEVKLSKGALAIVERSECEACEGVEFDV